MLKHDSQSETENPVAQTEQEHGGSSVSLAQAETHRLWTIIGENAHKVPHLRVSVFGAHLSIVNPHDSDEMIGLEFEGRPDAHRDVALLVIDAIEYAGLATFERSRLCGKYRWRRVGGVAVMSDDEHIAILSCVATFLQSLPPATASAKDTAVVQDDQLTGAKRKGDETNKGEVNE